MAEQALDVGRVWAQARRHRLLVSVVLVLGLGLGVASVLLLPPPYTSSSRVLLPPLPDTGDGSAERDGQTEVEVALSDVVLGPAGEALSPPLSVGQMLDHVQVRALTPDVLQFKAEAETAARAQDVADAVAKAELAYLGRSIEHRSTTRAAILAERETSLSDSLATVTDQIQATRARRDAAGSDASASAADATALAQLSAEQAKLVLALDEVRNLMTDQDGDLPATTIEKASPARRPGLVEQLALRGLLGCALALAAVLLALALLGRRDRRLRFRDEVADALGAVVLASVRSRVPRTTAGWSELLTSYQPGTVDAWALRQALRQLTAGTHATDPRPEGRSSRVPHPRSVTVISLAGDQRGLAMGPQLASYAASLDVSTHLVAAQGHDTAASLWAACGAGPVGGRDSLVVSTQATPSQADLTVVLAVVDPAHPVLRELPASDVTVLAVSSAAATAEDLARVAVTADDAGRRIVGVILADPDDLDRTTGRLLHHERAQQPPLPAHLTGVKPAGRAPGTVSGIRRGG